MIRNWQDWSVLIDQARNTYRKNPTSENEKAIRDLIAGALQDGAVVTPTIAYQYNDYGKPYSCHTQTELALTLVKTAVVLKDPSLNDLARKMLKVVTNLTSEGGLRTQTSAGSWFHGISSTDAKVFGGTLNKHLFAVRNLAIVSKFLNEPFYMTMAQQGYDQLLGNVKLKFVQFIPRSDSGTKTLRSWIWYSRTFDDNVGFHLKSVPDRNGGYHCLVMDLLFACKQNDIKMRDPSKFKWLYNVYKEKEKDGLYVNSQPGPNGSFKALEKGREADSDTLEWFKTL